MPFDLEYTRSKTKNEYLCEVVGNSNHTIHTYSPIPPADPKQRFRNQVKERILKDVFSLKNHTRSHAAGLSDEWRTSSRRGQEATCAGRQARNLHTFNWLAATITHLMLPCQC
jgi:hypothetical protein